MGGNGQAARLQDCVSFRCTLIGRDSLDENGAVQSEYRVAALDRETGSPDRVRRHCTQFPAPDPMVETKSSLLSRWVIYLLLMRILVYNVVAVRCTVLGT